MSNKVFLDCLGRQIKVGDVLAKSWGGIDLAVVRCFTEQKFVVHKIVGDWHSYVRGDYDKPGYFTKYRYARALYEVGNYCFITGMTEDDLRKIVTIEESSVNDGLSSSGSEALQ